MKARKRSIQMIFFCRGLDRRIIFPMIMAALFILLPSSHLRSQAREKPLPSRPVTARGPLLPDEQRAISLFEQAKASVVYITTLVYRRDLFSFNVFEIPQGTGSGFIWDEAGHIVTNFHVVYEAQDVQVTLFNGTVFKAEVVGRAPDKDLATLRIRAPGEKLRPILIGTSADLKVGQSVYAIGNPFGLDQTLTTGIISALGREIESLTRRPIRDVIQTDAAINPGNSGGPLLDSAGRLIGVNTAIYSPSGAYAGVGFAVPVDIVSRTVPQLIAYGKVSRPGLGIQIVTDSVARQVGIKEGVLVLNVDSQGEAARAGVMPTRYDSSGDIVLGDIIIAIEGQSIQTSDDLDNTLERYNVGDEVRVEVIREGRRRTLRVRLQEV